MSERNSLPFERSNGDSTQSENPYQLQPEEHLSIISAIAHRNWNEKINLPKIFIWDSQTPSSPIDELRKNIANHDRIKPFEPLSEKLPPVLGEYDPSNQSYWRAVQETIERWKHPSFIDAIRTSQAMVGYHFALNPNTGKIVLVKDRMTDEYRPDEDGFQDGRPQYHFDPNTGAIVKGRNSCTLEWREERDGPKDHYYVINPETGQIESRTNERNIRDMLL